MMTLLPLRLSSHKHQQSVRFCNINCFEVFDGNSTVAGRTLILFQLYMALQQYIPVWR